MAIAINKFAHTDFQAAADLLASKIDDLGDIELTGKKKYLQEHLRVNEQDTEQWASKFLKLRQKNGISLYAIWFSDMQFMGPFKILSM